MKIIYISLIFLLFPSCNKNGEDFKLNLTELTFSDIDIRCYPTDEGIIIDSDSAYQLFQDENNGDFCADFGYPTIDFTKSTLLGVGKTAGCRIGSKYWNVYIDEAKKVYIFQTILEGEGNCEALALDQFWVTVPKLPNDYTVQFVEYEY